MLDIRKGFDISVSETYRDRETGKKHTRTIQFCELKNSKRILREEWMQMVDQYIKEHNEHEVFCLLFLYNARWSWYQARWETKGKEECEYHTMECYSIRLHENLEWLGYEEFRRELIKYKLVEPDQFDGWIELRLLMMNKGDEQMNSEGAKKIEKQIEDFAKNNPLAKILGQYLMQQCESSEEVNKAIMNIDGQNTSRRIDEVARHITGFARKQAVNGMAMIEDNVVFDELCKYMGISEFVKQGVSVAPIQAPEIQVVEKEVVKEVVVEKIVEVEKVVEKPASSTKSKKKTSKVAVGQEDLFAMMGV